MSSVDLLDGQRDLGTVIRQTLANYPDNCNLNVSPVSGGWRFTSLKNYFESFITTSSISRWDAGQGLFTFKGVTLLFPDTIAHCQFDSGSILLVYRSGHIRWITKSGFFYYAFLTQGMTLSFTQGDLMLFLLPLHQLLPNRHALASRISANRGKIWAKAHSPRELTQTGQWIQSQDIIVGGSKSHRALGRMKILRPIENDYRSMQIITVGPVCIQHDPLDDIHPTLYLPPGQHYLITKLPGFSDPVKEMNCPDGVLI